MSYVHVVKCQLGRISDAVFFCLKTMNVNLFYEVYPLAHAVR